MGVPKFYRWLSERYPKINQLISDAALLPEFDHLYLDMNGIIHGATHPSDSELSNKISERDMMLGIMHYIDRIITVIVKPKKSVYMAIDGVAPRAKMNQQRSRRFRSAMDAKELTEEAERKGEKVDKQGLFDSNCITPGTSFMGKVSNLIKYFIRKKIKEDPLWKNLKVYFSGHEVPGEGEHKIMQHIRDMKAQPGYEPNTRHCMYGQDADLIMLGLVSHEPHFTLLREVVKFGFSKSNSNAQKAVLKNVKESEFQLLHLSVLREYLDIEFCYKQPKNTYNLEAIIDDFVFMTFLVGNDFLPHMPSLDIGDGAFDLLFDTYKAQRKKWGQNEYLQYAGNIVSPERLEKFLEVIGSKENEIFADREVNEAAFQKKKRRWDKRDGVVTKGPTDEELIAMEKEREQKYREVLRAEAEISGGIKKKSEKSVEENRAKDDNEDDDGMTLVKPRREKKGGSDSDSLPSFFGETGANGQSIESSDKDWQGRYYFEKLGMLPNDREKHAALENAYMEGLVWCLAYYYRGCISWGWFYPYHYGPMISDLKNLNHIFSDMKFDPGKPFLPFEQLMGCLPPLSADLVPRPYRHLMESTASPIHDFYPAEFTVDMNGKRNPWEGVNLLPFIDADRLRAAIKEFCPPTSLTAAERERNSFGNVLLFTHDPINNETVASCDKSIGLKDITICQSKVQIYAEPDRRNVSFKPEVVEGTRIPFPGFPSLNVLPFQNVELKNVQLNCFGSISKYSATVLELQKLPAMPPAEQLAKKVLGRSVFVNWPMMHEARVVAISDAKCEVRQGGVVTKWNGEKSSRWTEESEAMKLQYLSGIGLPGSGGVDVGEVQIRLKVVPLQGMKKKGDGSRIKTFGSDEAEVPLHMCLWKDPAPDPRFVENGPQSIREMFLPGTEVILTAGKYKGSKGVVSGVIEREGERKEHLINTKVDILPPEPPYGLAIVRSVNEGYLSCMEAAKILKMPVSVFGRITGNFSVDPGRYELGLNLKQGGTHCVPAYTRKKKEHGKENKSAWEQQDSLKVTGSAVDAGVDARAYGNGRGSNQNVVWEYSTSCLKLVALYQTNFPKVVSHLKRNPEERFYDVRSMFGEGGSESNLREVLDWLGKCETAKLPRVPVSTSGLGKNAVQAIERASEVRNNTLKAKGLMKAVQLKVPLGALYKSGSVDASDVLTSNNKETPELGDRVANLSAGGVPFGARGTVIAVHNKNGCVDVVMDEEFMGGSSLQGTCSNFRGKLCYWNHLLKLSSKEDSKTADSIVPKGVGKVAISGLLKKAEEEEMKEREIELRAKANADAAAGSGGRDKSSGRSRSTGKSPGMQKQTGGGYKEAVGPPMDGGKSRGFGRGRGFSSGLIASGLLNDASSTNKKNSKPAVTTSNSVPGKMADASVEDSNNLKAMLGVKGGKGGDTKDEAAAAAAAATNNAKRVLGGVKPVVNSTESNNLKAILGVGAGANANNVEVVKAEPPAPPSAADALLALMNSDNSGSDGGEGGGGGGGFNFAYTNEGEDSTERKKAQEKQLIEQRQAMNMLSQMQINSTIVERKKVVGVQAEEGKERENGAKKLAMLKPAAVVKR